MSLLLKSNVPSADSSRRKLIGQLIALRFTQQKTADKKNCQRARRGRSRRVCDSRGRAAARHNIGERRGENNRGDADGPAPYTVAKTLAGSSQMRRINSRQITPPKAHQAIKERLRAENGRYQQRQTA